jgi:hypothetical protein
VTVGNLAHAARSYVSAAGRSASLRGRRSVGWQDDRSGQADILEGIEETIGGAAVRVSVNSEYEITIRCRAITTGTGVARAAEINCSWTASARLFRSADLLGRIGVAPSHLDSHLKVRVPVSAGPHAIGVTFLKKPFLLLETGRQPYESRFNYYRHPRLQPAVYEISVVGPYNPAGAGDTPSRRRVFVCQPTSTKNEDACAKKILTTVMRRAYRRPVADADVKKPFELYSAAKAEEGFDAGIEMGLSAVLTSPEFLFRIERDPVQAGSKEQDPAYVRETGGDVMGGQDDVVGQVGRRAVRTASQAILLSGPPGRLSHQRSRAGDAALLLPVEQHSGRRAARCGGAGRSR